MVDIDLQFIGMIFETFILAGAIILLMLIMKKYLVKKHRLTFYLFIIFLNFIICILFSWITKILGVFSDVLGTNYINDDTIPAPNTLEAWFILRITHFRISFIFLAIGIYFTYILKVKLFEKGFNSRNRTLITIYLIFTITFSLFVYIKDNDLLDAINFIFILIFIVIVYFPLTYETFKSSRSTEVPSYKKGFLSLSIMGVCFVLLFINFLIDRIFIVLGSPGYTFFYFSGWVFVLLGIISAYLGYIKPR